MHKGIIKGKQESCSDAYLGPCHQNMHKGLLDNPGVVTACIKYTPQSNTFNLKLNTMLMKIH